MEKPFYKQRKTVYDLRMTLYGWEGTMNSPLSEFDIEVSARSGSEDYIQKCAEAFLNMSGELLESLLRATAAYALEHADEDSLYDEETGDEFTENSPLRDILKFVCPVKLVIQPPDMLSEDDAPTAFVVELNCDLETDGMEWAVRDGNAVYVGEYFGCDPWGYYPDDDNYINQI
ncbi:MAG: DUF6985 domain-containing protein [Oscillospiraceae bacterium]